MPNMDNAGEIKEALDDWQEIQSQTQTQSAHLHVETAAEDQVLGGDGSVASRDHSPSPPGCTGDSFPSLSSPPPHRDDDDDDAGDDLRRRLSDGIVRALKRICRYSTRRGVLCSSAALVAAILAGVLCARAKTWWRRRRARDEKTSRLIALLKDKDQKIRELLLQIARMKELLSERRRVAVVRSSKAVLLK